MDRSGQCEAGASAQIKWHHDQISSLMGIKCSTQYFKENNMKAETALNITNFSKNKTDSTLFLDIK